MKVLYFIRVQFENEQIDSIFRTFVYRMHESTRDLKCQSFTVSTRSDAGTSNGMKSKRKTTISITRKIYTLNLTNACEKQRDREMLNFKTNSRHSNDNYSHFIKRADVNGEKLQSVMPSEWCWRQLLLLMLMLTTIYYPSVYYAVYLWTLFPYGPHRIAWKNRRKNSPHFSTTDDEIF